MHWACGSISPGSARLPPDEAITEGYVRALFDDYAPKFDRHLTKSLVLSRAGADRRCAAPGLLRSDAGITASASPSISAAAPG